MSGLHHVHVMDVTDGGKLVHQIADDQVNTARSARGILNEDCLKLFERSPKGTVELHGYRQEIPLALHEIPNGSFSTVGRHKPDRFVLKRAHPYRFFHKSFVAVAFCYTQNV